MAGNLLNAVALRGETSEMAEMRLAVQGRRMKGVEANQPPAEQDRGEIADHRWRDTTSLHQHPTAMTCGNHSEEHLSLHDQNKLLVKCRLRRDDRKMISASTITPCSSRRRRGQAT